MPDYECKPKPTIDREWVSKDNSYPGKSISRRDFLKITIQGLGLVALGGFVRLLDLAGEKKLILRPPGALSEEHFRALCLPCGKCEEVCPQQVIQPVVLEESLETVGSPRLSFAENYCNLCMKCTQVCPTGALQPIPQSQVLIGIAKVITERCIAWKGGNCDTCVKQCPFKAIRKDNQGRPYVIPEPCTGCGICEQACRLTAKMVFTKGIIVFPIDWEEATLS